MTTVSDDENVGDKVEKKTEVSTDKKEDKKTRKREAPKITFSAVIPTILVSHFTGLLLFWSPETCARWAHVFSLVTMEAVTTGLLAYFIGATFLPYLTRRSISRAEPEAKDELLASWPLLKCLGLIWHGVLMGGLAMMNFSLGYLLTLVTVPVYCCVKPTNRRIHRLIQAVLVLLVSPMSLLFILMLFYHTTVLESTDVWTLLTDAVYTSRSALFDSVVNSYIHGNWTYPLAALLIFPNWLMFWSVLWQNP
uniref:Glycosylphosphatidylinositol anchor attachment 1 protein-like n=1 Tax=Saccoglossus kowalevskii TaxID=10224 RepID=A0ABM0MA03_SACKO|nr:PREDICTED: glycosylphosphatidylinositol anchor attachment 1 protein-like [Saccoglossus kowalevskii]